MSQEHGRERGSQKPSPARTSASPAGSRAWFGKEQAASPAEDPGLGSRSLCLSSALLGSPMAWHRLLPSRPSRLRAWHPLRGLHAQAHWYLGEQLASLGVSCLNLNLRNQSKRSLSCILVEFGEIRLGMNSSHISYRADISTLAFRLTSPSPAHKSQGCLCRFQYR